MSCERHCNAVIGYSQVLLEDAENEGDRQSVADLSKIQSAGQHLLKLVNEILDLSKIEAGKMELDLEETDICRTVRARSRTRRGLRRKKTETSINCRFAPNLERPLCDAANSATWSDSCSITPRNSLKTARSN